MAEAKKPVAKAAAAKTTAAKKPAAKTTATTAASKAPVKAPASAAAAATPVKATAAKTTAAKVTATKSAAKKPAVAAGPKVNTLKMHHLRPAEGARKAKIRVGRGEGGKRGKTAGRGTKGTGARYQVPIGFEGGQTPIHMRIPKLRGFKNPFRKEYQVVNISAIAELFPKGGKVTKAELVDRGAVRKNELVKVLGNGEIAVKVEIMDVDKVSQSAKTKIEAAGGSVNEG